MNRSGEGKLRQGRRTTYLTLCILAGTNTEASFYHRFLYDTDRVASLCCRVYTLLSHQSRNLATDGRKVMLSFLLSYLKLSLLQDLIGCGH